MNRRFDLGDEVPGLADLGFILASKIISKAADPALVVDPERSGQLIVGGVSLARREDNDLLDGESISNRYNKLDPISAQTMLNAPTGNPKIDAKVKKAARMPK